MRRTHEDITQLLWFIRHVLSHSRAQVGIRRREAAIGGKQGSQSVVNSHSYQSTSLHRELGPVGRREGFGTPIKNVITVDSELAVRRENPAAACCPGNYNQGVAARDEDVEGSGDKGVTWIGL